MRGPFGMIKKSIFFSMMAILMAVISFAPRSVHAHALLLSSQPASGAQVAGPALEIALHFNSRIDAARSRLTLVGPGGEKSLTAEKGANQAEMTAHAEGLGAGVYVLQWEALSVDGHVSRGTVKFSVKSAQ